MNFSKRLTDKTPGQLRRRRDHYLSLLDRVTPRARGTVLAYVSRVENQIAARASRVPERVPVRGGGL